MFFTCEESKRDYIKIMKKKKEKKKKERINKKGNS
jgi:hypothetical protein